MIPTAELCRRTGASERQVRFWAEKGYLAAPTSCGSGRYLRWPIETVGIVRTALARIEWGMAVGPALFRAQDPPLPTYAIGPHEIAPAEIIHGVAS